jgi:2-amino-4-hydroxy-6-hydroxymethyldihydropteridine diphosphokinase/dihydropteroate synthase
MKHRAFVALGSNLGDRVAMIEQACNEMNRTGKIRLLRTSSLWETKAMYVLDQDKFVNGVCEVHFSLSAACT